MGGVAAHVDSRCGAVTRNMQMLHLLRGHKQVRRSLHTLVTESSSTSSRKRATESMSYEPLRDIWVAVDGGVGRTYYWNMHSNTTLRVPLRCKLRTFQPKWTYWLGTG